MASTLGLGTLGWLGLAVLAFLALLLWRKPHVWLYVLFAALPGIALTPLGMQEHLGLARAVGSSLAFFATGTVVFGLPLAALGWWWLNRPASRPGTLE